MNNTSTNALPWMKEFLSAPATHIVIIFMLAITLMMSKLGGTGLATFDDAFYAEKAKEILKTGDWMTMHYDGIPHFENPPFFMWLITGSYKIFGVNEYAAKFPSALMGVLTVLLIYFMGKYLFSEWIGFSSALILSTTNIFTRYAGRAMMDVTLSFFVTLALFSLILGIRKNARFFFLWGISISICVLIKSVLGLFPAVISILFLLVTKRWKYLINPYFLLGCVGIATLGFSWYIHQSIIYGKAFLDTHFGWLILQRGFETQADPWYSHLSYAKDLMVYYWPWLPVFIAGLWKFLKKANQQHETEILCLIWVMTIFITMSMMQTRVVWYVMPIFPAAAIISGVTLDGWLGEKYRIIHARAWLVLTGIAIVIINATPIKLSKEREQDARMIAPYVRHFGSQHHPIIGFRQSYHALNNALLFYSDYSASPIVDRYDELQKSFSTTDTLFCVLDNAHIDSLTTCAIPYSVVRKTDMISLISNHPVEAYDVRN